MYGTRYRNNFSKTNKCHHLLFRWFLLCCQGSGELVAMLLAGGGGGACCCHGGMGPAGGGGGWLLGGGGGGGIMLMGGGSRPAGAATVEVQPQSARRARPWPDDSCSEGPSSTTVSIVLGNSGVFRRLTLGDKLCLGMKAIARVDSKLPPPKPSGTFAL